MRLWSVAAASRSVVSVCSTWAASLLALDGLEAADLFAFELDRDLEGLGGGVVVLLVA